MIMLVDALEMPAPEATLPWADIPLSTLLSEAQLEERTVRELWKTAIQAFPKTRRRQHVINRVKVERLKWTPYLGVRTLLVSARVLGEAYPDKEQQTYQTMVLFRNVAFHKQPATGLIKIKESTPPVWFQKLSMNDDVRLRCSCPDFRWRWNWECAEVDSLYGPKAPPYTPPNPEQYRGPVNPSGLPGICKHTMNLGLTLIKAGAVSL